VKLAEMCAAAPSVGVDSFKGIMLGQALDFGHAWTNFLAVTGNIDNPGGQPLPDLTPLSPVLPAPAGPNLAKRAGTAPGRTRTSSASTPSSWSRPGTRPRPSRTAA
jgi:hypothetical protein